MAEPLDGAVMVIAKTPEAGRSKTRLSPPLSPDDACAVAWACLHDTLAALGGVDAARHVLVLDGDPGAWVPSGFEVVPQRGDGLGERLATAFTDVGGPAIVIAMDTPQVTTAMLHEALAAVVRDPGTASFGPASDGGFWLLGLGRGVRPDAVFAGIPMSVEHTGAAQLARLRRLGLAVHAMPELRDIDVVDDLWAVAAELPSSAIGRVARAVHDDVRAAG